MRNGPPPSPAASISHGRARPSQNASANQLVPLAEEVLLAEPSEPLVLTPALLAANPQVNALVVQFLQTCVLGQASEAAVPGSVPGRPFSLDSLLAFEERYRGAVRDEVRVEGKSLKTAAWRIDALRSFCRFVRTTKREVDWTGGDWRRQEATIKEWVAWMRTNAARGALMSRRTINGYFRSMRSIVATLAHEDGAFVPFSHIAIPRAGEPSRPRPLPAIAPELLDAVEQFPWRSELERTRNASLIHCYVLGGLRRDEPLTLTNADVNLDTGDILVRGKGRDGGKYRTVACPRSVGVFRRYIQAKRDAGRTEPFFLVSLTRAGGITASAVRGVLRHVEQVVGIHVTAQQLRRTATDLWREAGVPLPTIQRQLGHKHLSMSLYYSFVSDASLRRDMGRVDLEALRRPREQEHP